MVSPLPARPTEGISVEICIDDLDGALTAERSGAERVEVCADLVEGGTTPSLGLVRTILESTSRVGVQVMIRSRGGDFVYSAAELEVMHGDIRVFRELAARHPGRLGLVFGALTAERRIDIEVLRGVLDAAGDLPITFHKAFDETPDLLESYDLLAQLGVSRVLTSGGADTAERGAGMLRLLVERQDTGPVVLAGGRIRPLNVAATVLATGVREVHLRAQVPSSRNDGGLTTDAGIVSELIAELRSIGDAATAAARDEVVLALDIGGTNLKGAVVDATGRVVLAETVAAEDATAEPLDLVRSLLARLSDVAEADGHRVIGAGIVTPGIIDPDTGTVLYASTLRWTDVPLGTILSDDLGVPVAIGHDVRAAGLAEALFGASTGASQSVLVAIGTGVAASILTSGVQVVGELSSAGELGHIPAHPHGEDCTCGQRGCLEVYMSGAGLARRYAAFGGMPLSAEEIVGRLTTDPLADRVWAHGIEALALGLKTVTLLLDPAVVVLTGGVSRAGDALLVPLRAELSASLAWRAAPRVETSVLGTSGGRIGASVLAFRAAGRAEVPDRWQVETLLSPYRAPQSSVDAGATARG